MGSRQKNGGVTGLRAVYVPRQKQLVFDRRYGWVYDEWTDPVEVAHTGGRGKFSIVPLSATALNVAFHLANKAADAVVQILQNPLPSCILECRACVLRQLQKFELQNSGRIEQTYQSSSTEKVQSSSTEKVHLGKSWGSTLKAGNWKQISRHSKSYQDSYYSVDPDGFRG
ncbi:unnamed protein product [Sphagnum balticum]